MTAASGEPEDRAAEDDTIVVHPGDRDDGGEETAIRRRPARRRGEDEGADPLLGASLDAETGSTVVVRRESRRRAELAAHPLQPDLDATIGGAGVPPLPVATAGDIPAPLVRAAVAPTAAPRAYDVRAAGRVAPRAGTPTHPLQEPIDTAAGQAARRRRARRRAVIAVVAASVVMVAAIALLIVLVVGG